MSQETQTPLQIIKARLAELKEAREKATPNGWEWEKTNYFDGMELTSRRWVTCMVSDDNNHHESTDGGKEVDANMNFISLSSAQWLNLLQIIEIQADALHRLEMTATSKLKAGRTEFSYPAKDALVTTAQLLKGGG